jgi:hypothetical protein
MGLLISAASLRAFPVSEFCELLLERFDGERCKHDAWRSPLPFQ